MFAAASLTESFSEIAERFEMEVPGVEILFNFAGSSQLAQQIALGAPADVFASADEFQMQAAIDAGKVAAMSALPFAGNRLVMIFPHDNPAGVSRLQDLATPGIRLVIAERSVPVGNYSLVFLEKAQMDPEFGPEFKDDVLSNVVTYEPNTRFVLSKVLLGEMDAGIVYLTDAFSAGEPGVGRLDIPTHLNVTALYYIAPLVGSQHPNLASEFLVYVLSPVGREILTRNGLSLP